MVCEPKLPCPCGKGFYIVSEFYYQEKPKQSYSMECPSCAKKYQYVHDYMVVSLPRGNELQKGWAPIEEIAKKRDTYIRNIEAKVKILYSAMWKSKFTNLNTKKESWSLLTLDGKYEPSLNSFYNKTRGYSHLQLEIEIDNYFTYANLKRIFEILEVEPNWEYMDIDDRDKIKFYPDFLIAKKVSELKLKAELVPKSSWYDNMRKVMNKKHWEDVRNKTISSFEFKCGICGAEETLECHEVWEYSDDKKIQKLSGFIALCKMCHLIKHIGYAQILSSKGQLDYEKLINHFITVNKSDRLTFKLHNIHAFSMWKERSKEKWDVDLADYKDLVKTHSKR